MKVAVAFSGRFALEVFGDLSSFLLHDPLGNPILAGLEYVMPEGPWTFADADDDDFYRILGTSGILHTLIPGSRPLWMTMLLEGTLPVKVQKREGPFAEYAIDGESPKVKSAALESLMVRHHLLPASARHPALAGFVARSHQYQ